jgi:hypothetical protein
LIRQAHTYLVGALSGVTLIAIAIAAFVFLVSTQVFHEWPIVAIGTASHKTAVAPAKALSGGTQTASAGTSKATAATAPTAPRRHHAAATKTATVAPTATPTQDHQASSTGGGDATSPATVVATAPTSSGRGNRSSPGGGNSSSHSSKPSSSSTNSPSSTTSSPSGSSPSGSSGSSGSSSGSGTTGSSSGSSGSGGSSGSAGGGGGGGTTTGPVTAGTKQLSEVLPEVVDGTVSGVDETVLGGTLEETGVTQVTEEVVNGVAGPESLVGQTVDGAGEVVGGLLGGGH